MEYRPITLNCEEYEGGDMDKGHMLFVLDGEGMARPKYIEMAEDGIHPIDKVIIAMNMKPAMIEKVLGGFGGSETWIDEDRLDAIAAEGDTFIYNIEFDMQGANIISGNMIGDAYPELRHKYDKVGVHSGSESVMYRYDHVKFTEAQGIADDIAKISREAERAGGQALTFTDDPTADLTANLIIGKTDYMLKYCGIEPLRCAGLNIKNRISDFERDYGGDTIAESARYKKMFEDRGMDISEYAKDFGGMNIVKECKAEFAGKGVFEKLSLLRDLSEPDDAAMRGSENMRWSLENICERNQPGRKKPSSEAYKALAAAAADIEDDGGNDGPDSPDAI